MLFVVLSASSGDLFYYSYPPVCGQISRLKAAAKHHSDFEPSVFKQTRDFRHWLLLSGSTSLLDRTEIIRYRAMYFCSVVKRFYKRLLLVASSFQFLTTTKKNSRCRLPWSDDAIVGDQGMMRVMRCYLRGHLYYMPRIRSDHTRLEYIITWPHCQATDQATDQANEIKSSVFLEHKKPADMYVHCT